MELHLPKRIEPFFWRVFPIPFLLIAYYHIFQKGELTGLGFNELENVGSLIFILGVSMCEAALTTVFIWVIVESVKKLLRSPK